MWKQIEATPTHLTFLILSGFLILYALFSVFIRNRLHLSEPPLALLTGIFFGPRGAGALDPKTWHVGDNITQEFTRVIVGIQVFVVAVELPPRYLSRHWRSILMLLGPVMAVGWLVVAGFITLLFKTDFATSLIISACLTPTDPVLAASVLSNSKFSRRVPRRIKDLLAAESGCNDGISFPFLYAGLHMLTKQKPIVAFRDWMLLTVLWQCVLGIVVGMIIGLAANRLLRLTERRSLIGPSAFLSFYLLLALLSVGVGSTLGLDDFLVAFGAGAAFGHDGWFDSKTRASELNNTVDLLLNSTFFVYFGTIIPWEEFSAHQLLRPHMSPAHLVGLLLLVLFLRRIPVVLALSRYIPGLRTAPEALFAGHFGPMGVGALFLAIEARAHLETGTSLPLPNPPGGGDPVHIPGRNDGPLSDERLRAIHLVWPIVCFIVMGSTLVHGFSVAALSIAAHFSLHEDRRAGFVGSESEPLGGMVHDESGSEESDKSDDSEDEAPNGHSQSGQNGRIALPA